MVTKECLKRIIWILLSAVFLVGCYDDGNYITEEETIESESPFYYESEEVSLSMVLSLFDIINSDPAYRRRISCVCVRVFVMQLISNFPG